MEHKAQIRQAANVFRAMGSPVRLCLLEKLVREGETNVSDITSCMEVSQSCVSQHLAKLRDMGLVQARKENREVYYSCTSEKVRRLIAAMEEGN